MKQERNQDFSEDGYGPSEDEDGDYNEEFTPKRLALLDNFNGGFEKRRALKRSDMNFFRKVCDFKEYGPSEDQADDWYGKSATKKVPLLETFNRDFKIKMERKRGRVNLKEDCNIQGNLRDPLVVFGWDIMLMILSHLDARSVALSLLVSRSWHGVASSDTLWSKKCEELWVGKAHIPRLSKVEGLSKLAVYSLSMMDGERSRIVKEDLWDHAWEFHFNKTAPEYWRNLDPYWKGTGPPMRRYFHPDGSQTADPGDRVWGGHECCYTIVTGVLEDGTMREHYVRINRWPRMSVYRKPDWGWEMSNHLYCYSSVPDAATKGGTGPCYLAC